MKVKIWPKVHIMKECNLEQVKSEKSEGESN